MLVAALAHAQPATTDEDYINPDRPGIADGSSTVGAGRVYIEAGVQKEYRGARGSRIETAFLPLLLRFGVRENLEIRIEGNTYTWTKTNDPALGVGRSDGMAPTSVGVKYKFMESNGAGQPAIATIVRFFPPSGSGDFRSPRSTGDVRVAADWNLSPQWSLNPNIGLGFYRDDSQRPYTAGLLAVTLGYNASKSLSFFIDAGMQSPEMKHGRAAVLLDLGTAYLIGRDLQLDFSAGARAAGSTPPRFFLSAGISRRY